MKIVFIIIAIIVVAIFIFLTERGNKKSATNRPSDDLFPKQKRENDKIIIIKGISVETANEIIIDFCNTYNQKKFVAIPKLLVFDDCQAVLFPYDIDFEYFCYFVNHIRYGRGSSFPKTEVTGWTITKEGDGWMTNEILGKQVMLYIPDSDTEYDNVYLTTEDNLCFKMGFAYGEEHIKQATTIKYYEDSPFDEIINSEKIVKSVDLK